jgi:hypothetical protein
MNPTTESLAKYIGGQLEVQNTNEGYVYRGEISSIAIKGNDLTLKLKWNAKMRPEGWINDTKLDYAASLEIYTCSEIGDDRFCLASFITGETVVLFPSNVSNERKLDPSKVKGLAPLNKASIYVWVEGHEQLKALGYTDKQEIKPEDVFKIAEEIFRGGLNVMIFHTGEDQGHPNIVLAVDTRRFQQR